jgi:predicted anti-sigma-YlaC factor YlaD
MPSGLTCRELVLFLDDYLEGRLRGQPRARFDRHLEGCAACASYARSYAAALRMGRAALACAEQSVPDEVPEELVRAILDLRAGGR